MRDGDDIYDIGLGICRERTRACILFANKIYGPDIGILAIILRRRVPLELRNFAIF